MRYISLLLFVFAMYLSWQVAESPAAIPESTHVLIQEDLKRIITEKIQQELSTAKDIQFDRFWSQNVKGDKVKANFTVSFELDDGNDSTRHGIQGQYLLTLDKGTNQWSGDGDFEYTQITFKNGVVIEPTNANQQ